MTTPFLSIIPGGWTPYVPVTPYVRYLALTFQSQVQQLLGAYFYIYNPITYATQIVNGTNYSIRIDIGYGRFIQVRLYTDLNGITSLTSAIYILNPYNPFYGSPSSPYRRPYYPYPYNPFPYVNY